jgi:hypothetical protein
VNTKSAPLNLWETKAAVHSLAQISKGENVTVIETTGEWTQIEYGGQTGFVKTQYLEFTDQVIYSSATNLNESISALGDNSSFEELQQTEQIIQNMSKQYTNESNGNVIVFNNDHFTIDGRDATYEVKEIVFAIRYDNKIIECVYSVINDTLSIDGETYVEKSVVAPPSESDDNMPQVNHASAILNTKDLGRFETTYVTMKESLDTALQAYIDENPKTYSAAITAYSSAYQAGLTAYSNAYQIALTKYSDDYQTALTAYINGKTKQAEFEAFDKMLDAEFKAFNSLLDADFGTFNTQLDAEYKKVF